MMCELAKFLAAVLRCCITAPEASVGCKQISRRKIAGESEGRSSEPRT